MLARWPDVASRVSLQTNTGCTAASAVLTNSGTISLHCVLAGIPGAVVHKTLTYWLTRHLAGAGKEG